MDLSVFKPLKLQYDEAIIKWQRKNYGIKLPKSMFSSIISKVWEELSSETIKNGFRKTGIYPFCDTILPNEIFEPAALKRFQVSLAENSSMSGPSLLPSVDNTVSNPGCSEYIANNPSTSDTTTIVHASGDDNVDNAQEEAGTSMRDEHSFETILLRHLKQTPSAGQQKRRKMRKICPGAEIITCSDIVQKLKEKKQEEAILVKKRKQSTKAKKDLPQDSSDTSEDEQHGFPGEQSDSDDDVEWGIPSTPPIEEQVHWEVQPDDFVLMKFPIEGVDGTVYYVSKGLNCFDQEVEVSCLRKSVKSESKFYFPQVLDISTASKSQIEFVLPEPIALNAQTKRQKALILFPISIDQYNVC